MNNNNNTFDPSQFSNMAGQTNDFDFLNINLDNLDPDDLYDMSFDLNLPEVSFNENSGYPDSFLDQPQDMFPTQQQQQQQQQYTTPNQAAPAFAPPPGAAYHPDIGYYYPAPAPIPAQQQVPTFTTPFNAPPVVESTQMPELTRPAANKNKRKYGPGVYGEEQAKRCAIGDDSGPRPVSRESVDFHVQGRKTKQKSGITSRSKKRVGKAAESASLKAATVQNCRCKAAKAVIAAHIPRPPNSFMLFRSDFAAEWATTEGEKRGSNNPTMSSAAANRWKADKKAKKDTEAKYQKMADEQARVHKELYPNYKYDTSIRIKAKFGRPDCTCGAYVKNSAALQKRLAGLSISGNVHNAAIDDNEDEDEDEDEGEADEYVMPTTRSQSRANSLLASAPIDQTIPYPFDFNLGGDDYVMPTTRSQSRANSLLASAPTDQAYPFQFDYNLQDESANVPNFGFSFQSQDDAAKSQSNARNNYANAAEDDYVPPATRRSTRIAQQAISYAEEIFDHEEGFDSDVEMTEATPTREKRRPSPIVTLHNGSPKTSEFVNISPESDGPAFRTRSKSVSFDASQYQEASMGDDLFGDGWNPDEDIGENIILATPMTALSNVSPKNRSGWFCRTAKRGRRGARVAEADSRLDALRFAYRDIT
jgi:hypothetical protein